MHLWETFPKDDAHFTNAALLAMNCRSFFGSPLYLTDGLFGGSAALHGEKKLLQFLK